MYLKSNSTVEFLGVFRYNTRSILVENEDEIFGSDRNSNASVE